MDTIQSSKDLKLAIAKLEQELILEKKELVTEAHTTLESINPLSSIKAAIYKIKSPSSENNTVLNTVIGLGTGLLVKKIMPAKPGGFLKNIASVLLQLGLTHRLLNNKEAINTLNQEILYNAEDHA